MTCKDCEHRTADCHVTCEAYRDYYEQNEEVKKKRREYLNGLRIDKESRDRRRSNGNNNMYAYAYVRKR